MINAERRQTRLPRAFGSAAAQRSTVGNSCMVRLHASRHSAFVMCVAGSQNPMQSAKLLPPPPGALGADSLGLLDEAPGDRARLPEPVVPPVENCVGSCGESGAIAGAWGVGEPTTDGGLDVLSVTGAAGGPLLMTPLVDDVPGRTGLAEGDPDRSCARPWPLPVTIPPILCNPPPADRAVAASGCREIIEIATAARGQARRSTSMGHHPFPAAPESNVQPRNSFDHLRVVAGGRLGNRQAAQWDVTMPG